MVVEIAADHVAAAHWGNSRGALDACAIEPLQVGSIMASPVETNVTQPDAVRSALRAVFNRVPDRGAPLALLVPDLVVRVFILPFDSLPRRAGRGVARPSLAIEKERSVRRGRNRRFLDAAGRSARQSGGRHGHRSQEHSSRIRRDRRELGRAEHHRFEFDAGHLAVCSKNAEPRLLARMSGKTLTTVVVSGSNLCVYRATDMLAEADILDPATDSRRNLSGRRLLSGHLGRHDRPRPPCRVSVRESEVCAETLEQELKFAVTSAG